MIERWRQQLGWVRNKQNMWKWEYGEEYFMISIFIFLIVSFVRVDSVFVLIFIVFLIFGLLQGCNVNILNEWLNDIYLEVEVTFRV